MEPFWHLTVCKQTKKKENYTNSKPNYLTPNSALTDLKWVDMP